MKLPKVIFKKIYKLKLWQKTAIIMVLIALFIAPYGLIVRSVAQKYLSYKTCTTHRATYRIKPFEIEGATVRLLVATTPDLQEYGLMNIRTKADICGYDGMIFEFATPSVQYFWNKNTYVDLDLYFVSGDRIVETTFLPNINKTQSAYYVNSTTAVDRVIEVIKK